MSQNPNPFLRGYWNLKIVRTLSISYEDGSPHVWRNIHPSQQHLCDAALVSSPCIITSDFAVVRTGTEPVGAALIAECDAAEGGSGEGMVGAVVYAIHGEPQQGDGVEAMLDIEYMMGVRRAQMRNSAQFCAICAICAIL